MASKYYDPAGKYISDGTVADAPDINNVNDSVNAGFELVESDMVTIVGGSEAWANIAREWAIADYQPEPGYESSKTYSLRAADSAAAAAASANECAVIEGNILVSEINAANCAAESHASAQESFSYQQAAYSSMVAAEAAAGQAQAYRDQSLQYSNQSLAYAQESQNWAMYPEDTPVPEGSGSEYSAYHWSKKAELAAGGGLTDLDAILPITVDKTNPNIPIIGFDGQGTDIAAIWGNITGDINSQSDLTVALEAKEDKLPFPDEDGKVLNSLTDGTKGWVHKLSSVQAGTDVIIDDGDPLNPIINVSQESGGITWQVGAPAAEPEVGIGYMVNTLTNPVDIPLPVEGGAFPDGGIFGVADLFSNFDVNNVIFRRNTGQTIMGAAQDMSASTKNTSVVLTLLGSDWRVVAVTPQSGEGAGGGGTPALVSHVQVAIPAAVFASGLPITIGTAPGGFNVQAVQVAILEVFDGGASLTVGTDAEPEQLLAAPYTNPMVLGAYGKANNLPYAGTPEFKVFPSGTPTVGLMRVTVYFN